jgi:hypothetical protein
MFRDFERLCKLQEKAKNKKIGKWGELNFIPSQQLREIQVIIKIIYSFYSQETFYFFI